MNNMTPRELEAWVRLARSGELARIIHLPPVEYHAALAAAVARFKEGARQ